VLSPRRAWLRAAVGKFAFADFLGITASSMGKV